MITNGAMVDEHIRAIVLDENNPSAERFYGMGFTLGNFEMEVHYERFGPDYIRVRGEFVCICGRRETFSTIQDKRALQAGHFNFYETLDRIGSMSRKHLLADGYTPEQIDAMEARYQATKGRP